MLLNYFVRPYLLKRSNNQYLVDIPPHGHRANMGHIAGRVHTHHIHIISAVNNTNNSTQRVKSAAACCPHEKKKNPHPPLHEYTWNKATKCARQK